MTGDERARVLELAAAVDRLVAGDRRLVLSAAGMVLNGLVRLARSDPEEAVRSWAALAEPGTLERLAAGYGAPAELAAPYRRFAAAAVGYVRGTLPAEIAGLSADVLVAAALRDSGAVDRQA